MIKAVTFDCWDTLIIDDEGRDGKMLNYLEFVCQENSISLASKNIADAFAIENKLREEYVAARQKTKNAMQRTETLLELLDVQLPLSEVVRIAYYFDRVALEFLPPRIPEVADVLKGLSQYYPLGVICNTGFHSGDTLRKILDTHEILREFTWLSFSNELGVAKPHRHIFEHTARKLGCLPEETVHIGDSEYTDIRGAIDAHMKAILFTGVNNKHRDITTADFVIDSYSDLLGLLEKL
jgi:FMN phosphatase YigB (HAD superfamily)